MCTVGGVFVIVDALDGAWFSSQRWRLALDDLDAKVKPSESAAIIAPRR